MDSELNIYGGSTGINMIANERKEQIEKHGWSMNHDDGHHDGEIAIAAMHLIAGMPDYIMIPSRSNKSARTGPRDIEYLRGPCNFVDFPKEWPRERFESKDRIHQLQVAGALIAAEIDRLARLPKDQRI